VFYFLLSYIIIIWGEKEELGCSQKIKVHHFGKELRTLTRLKK
jgi:hypothetical protein